MASCVPLREPHNKGREGSQERKKRILKIGSAYLIIWSGIFPNLINAIFLESFYRGDIGSI